MMTGAGMQLLSELARAGADGPVLVGGAHNGLGAKLVEEAGFGAIWASGFEISAAHCVPDRSLLPMGDYLRAAYDMVRAVALPVIADCDTGFGDADRVRFMVSEYGRHGVSAICIEDKPDPKINSLTGQVRHLASITEFADKIRAARRGAQGHDIAVIARTEALVARQGVDEALRRADAYVEAGAEALVVHSLDPSATDLDDFMTRWDRRVPVIAIATRFTEVKINDLEEMGVSAVVFPNHGLRAAVRSVREILEALISDGGVARVEHMIARVEDVFEIQGEYEWTRTA